MMRPPFQRLRRRLRNLRRPGAAELAFVAVALACILLPQWWAISRNREQRREELRAALLTTLETTKQAVGTWANDKAASARRIATNPGVRREIQKLREKGKAADPAALLAALRAADGRVDDGAPFVGFVLVDSFGAPFAADRAEDATRRWNPSDYMRQRGAPGVFHWPASSNSALQPNTLEVGVAAPLTPRNPEDADEFLLLRFDALPDLKGLIASRTLGKSGRTVLFDAAQTWVRQSASGDVVECETDPQKTIQVAMSAAALDARKSSRSSYNLDGFPTCDGSSTLAAWDSVGMLDLGLLTEISAVEAYQSHTATQLTFAFLGLAVGACLLLFVLFQTSSDEHQERRQDNPRRNMAAWGILAVALFATGVGWLSAQSRLEQNDRIKFEESAENVRAQVVQRLARYKSALKVAATSYQSFGDAQSEEWRSMIRTLYADDEYPGFRCVGLFRRQTAEGADSSKLRCEYRVLGDAACSLCRPEQALEAGSLDDLQHSNITMNLQRELGSHQAPELVLLHPTGSPNGAAIGAALDVASMIGDLSLSRAGVSL
jgi:hypothetical protein